MRAERAGTGNNGQPYARNGRRNHGGSVSSLTYVIVDTACRG
ncbi:hypothetical protein SLNWT_1731 [Streptomyces albus]|uniref:Uncharacterized protein n=1 Tax=Streptomyces albus (strain ATCC 21838 / DSM 41398 / FERM P-419 / JCM 4703 / NBRC 107858) TaxID=1081613 RepID=A0A0B5EVI3_STRA4|nr:hypothetical protein SLNWT_1731 [Streptomyces albus]AOU76423.1 hypothetical protein SLNHY_1732 [Streptomyces albus]